MESKVLLAKFWNITQFNSQFSKCNVAIAYHGDNRNYTSISKEVFEKMIPSLYGIPVVGEWKGEDFGTHGGKIEISDEGIQYIETTKPYGFVDSQAKVWWETITEDDGSTHEYLMTECFLWTGRYPEATKVLEGNSNQSMEIYVKSGNVRDDGYYEITDAEFSALCILGSSVEPCFESAGFKQFNLNKEDFKEEFNLMVAELKKSFTQENIEGGEEMKKKTEEVISMFTTYNQKREALRKALTSDLKRDDEGNIVEETYYWLADFDDNYVYVEKDQWINGNYSTEYGRFTYTFNEETLEATITGEFEKMVLVWLTVEENQKIQEEREQYINISQELENLKSEFTILQENYNKVLADNEELNKFKENVLIEKKQKEIDEIFEKYSELLSEEDLSSLKENAINMELEDLEKELSYMVVQKKFSFKKTNKKDNTKIKISNTNDIDEPYGSISIYFNKK